MLFVTAQNDTQPLSLGDFLKRSDVAQSILIPWEIPRFTTEELDRECNLNFNERFADLLNRIFDSHVTDWDVRTVLGQNPIRVHSIPHRVHFVDLWNNPKFSMDAILELLPLLGCGDHPLAILWCKTAYMTAALFQAYTELKSRNSLDEEGMMDVSVAATDFASVNAVLTAQQLGLPIGKILCGCNSNSSLWDFARFGELRFKTQIAPSELPLCDCVAPAHLVQLIAALLGNEEAIRYQECSQKKTQFTVNEEDQDKITGKLYASVIGDNRLRDLITTIASTEEILMNPYCALAYAALQDYRYTGANVNEALILSERSPLDDADYLTRLMNNTYEEIQEIVNRS